MQKIIIREMLPGEIEKIIEIALAAWQPIYASYRQILGEELYAALHPDWQHAKSNEVRKACMPESGIMVFVLENGERIAGFITFSIDDASKIGLIGNNAIHPDFQRMGLGKKMYQYVLDEFKKLGMIYAKVLTGGDPAHAPARKAYEKMGFSIRMENCIYFRKL
ncbi:GNAT family N-acetyltransferase [candidate division KSB1 bacterium]|nr:GNAT family N-acetyltransferase [candidate division KSB1 bacterium]